MRLLHKAVRSTLADITIGSNNTFSHNNNDESIKE